MEKVNVNWTIFENPLLTDFGLKKKHLHIFFRSSQWLSLHFLSQIRLLFLLLSLTSFAASARGVDIGNDRFSAGLGVYFLLTAVDSCDWNCNRPFEFLKNTFFFLSLLSKVWPLFPLLLRVCSLQWRFCSRHFHLIFTRNAKGFECQRTVWFVWNRVKDNLFVFFTANSFTSRSVLIWPSDGVVECDFKCLHFCRFIIRVAYEVVGDRNESFCGSTWLNLREKWLKWSDEYSQFEWFVVQAKALGSVLFEQVCKQLNLLESDYFGLEYAGENNTRYWIDMEKPINRQMSLSLSDPLLRFGIKFYTPDPAQLEEEFTRYLFCMQIKQDLAIGVLQCNDKTAALIASYLVQGKCRCFSC